MSNAVQAYALAASVLLLVAAWCDVATRTIPDGISFALAAIGLVARSFDGLGPPAFSFLTALALFAVFLVLHARGFIGGGDVKLIAALATGLPPLTTLDFLIATVMAGGVLGLLYLSLRFLPQPAPLPPQPHAWPPRRVLALERRRVGRRCPLPYAVAIAAGGIFTLTKPFGG